MSRMLQYTQAGNLDSPDLIVFLQGWPDNAEMWKWINWKEELSDKHLLFINFPNTNGNVDLKWGKDFPEIVDDLKLVIGSLNVTKKNKILVGHDWGCVYGYMFDQKFPGFFSQVIMMDVPAVIQLKTIKQVLYVFLYQMFLIIAFLIGGRIGKTVTQGLMKAFKHNPPYAQKVNSSLNYPYYYFWRNTILSKLKLTKKYLKEYRPSVPVVYLYGSIKPFQFHAEKWMKMVEESGGQVHKMEAGHWFMKKYGKFITDLIQRRLLPKL